MDPYIRRLMWKAVNDYLESLSDEERKQLIKKCSKELEKKLEPFITKKKTAKDIWKEFVEEEGGSKRLM